MVAPQRTVSSDPMEAYRPVTLALVAAGSAFGGLLRHAITEAVLRLPGGTAPAATLAINVAGSAAAGAIAAMVGQRWPVEWSPAARYAVMTGLLGGFTTFSAFSAQTLALMQAERWAVAVLYVTASAGLSVAGCALGFAQLSAGR